MITVSAGDVDEFPGSDVEVALCRFTQPTGPVLSSTHSCLPGGAGGHVDQAANRVAVPSPRAEAASLAPG